MEVFQVIDDKNNCFGLYSGGKFTYDRIPNTFRRTHCWSQHLLGHDVEYSYLFSGGKSLSETCPSHLKERYEARERKIKAFVNSFVKGKINIDEACIFDLIPTAHLKHYLDVKNQICQHVFDTYERPANYSFLRETYETIREISLQKLKVNWKLLESLAKTDLKAGSLLKRFSGRSIHVNYNMFGTKTGRLSINEGSFPILNVKTENKVVLRPQNDWFVELDYNGAEVRTLFSLSDKKQPAGDVHDWNMQNLYDRVKTRDGAKKKFFAWLYNPEAKDEASDSFYDREKILDSYYSNGFVETPFGRKIESDDFHALNYLLQSSSSDNCIRQVNKIHRFLRNKKSNVAFVVHDSVVIDLSNEERHLLPQIKEIFEDTRLGRFPVGIKVGQNYGQLRSFSW